MSLPTYSDAEKRSVPTTPATEPVNRRLSPLRRFFRILGPGLITGASDDDPSGIGTYSVAGARFGYSLLWTALLTFPLMSAVQLICARIALATGKGIATVLSEHYPRRLVTAVVVALLIANTINVGADILAIAAGVNLLVPIRIGVADRADRLAHPGLAGLGVVSADRERLQMADAFAIRLHCGVAACKAGLGRGRVEHICADRAVRRAIFFDAGGDPGNDHFAVSFLLASQPGSRGASGSGAALALATPNCGRSRNQARVLGCRHRHVLFEHCDVFHHIGDGSDSAPSRPH